MTQERSEPDPGLRLSKPEREEAEERSTVRPQIVYAAIHHEGVEELARPAMALAWSGLAAGLSMGFSMAAEGLLMSHLPDRPWRPLVMSWGYGVGFLLVVLGRQQLFTENTLTVVLPLLTSRGGEQWKTLGRVARVWGVVLAANLAGAFLFAWVVHTGAVFDATTRDAFVELGTRSLHPFAETFVNGLFAGWLIALMVWLLPAAETARVWVILVITYVVGLGQFAHVVVGSLSGFTAVLAGAMSWGQFVGTFFLPTLLGNVIGGTALVAALNHAQVIRGREPKPLVH